MDFGAIKVFEAILAAAGWKIAIAVLLAIIALIASVRMAPQVLADRRARDREDADARVRAAKAVQDRIDVKDATLEKILTNHIAHLEIQLSASREFYEVATERLASISADMKEARNKLDSVGAELAEVKLDTTVLRDRH
jgi:hypothetical protein